MGTQDGNDRVQPPPFGAVLEIFFENLRNIASYFAASGHLSGQTLADGTGQDTHTRSNVWPFAGPDVGRRCGPRFAASGQSRPGLSAVSGRYHLGRTKGRRRHTLANRNFAHWGIYINKLFLCADYNFRAKILARK